MTMSTAILRHFCLSTLSCEPSSATSRSSTSFCIFFLRLLSIRFISSEFLGGLLSLATSVFRLSLSISSLAVSFLSVYFLSFSVAKKRTKSAPFEEDSPRPPFPSPALRSRSRSRCKAVHHPPSLRSSGIATRKRDSVKQDDEEEEDTLHRKHGVFSSFPSASQSWP